MSKQKNITLVLLFLSLVALIYIFWQERSKKDTTQKKPIVIAPIEIPPKKDSHTDYIDTPEEILSKLKAAVQDSKKISKLTQEEMILASLTKTISQQEQNKKILKQQTTTLKRREIENNNTKVIQKEPTPIPTKVVLKKELVPTQKRKLTQKRKSVKSKKVKQNSTSKKSKKVASKASTTSTIKRAKIVDQKKSTLEPSNPKHKESIASQQSDNTTMDDTNLPFVKKLGVVAISEEYESNFSIPKKIEIAKEGIVSIPTATTNTTEIENLEFVHPLEVVEVSEAFETIEADKYLE